MAKKQTSYNNGKSSGKNSPSNKITTTTRKVSTRTTTPPKKTKTSRTHQATSNTMDNNIIDEKMYLANIRNRYIYNSNSPNSSHTYIVYRDKRSKEIRAIPTTHLYIPDEKNFKKLKKGYLCKVKFDGFETPSGVNNYYYNKNSNNENIDLSSSDIIVEKKPISQRIAQIIKKFAKSSRK